jgi:ATP-binding cassette subfamily B protein
LKIVYIKYRKSILDKGKVLEGGNNSELVALKGEYYRLVKNQLELGN